MATAEGYKVTSDKATQVTKTAGAGGFFISKLSIANTSGTDAVINVYIQIGEDLYLISPKDTAVNGGTPNGVYVDENITIGEGQALVISTNQNMDVIVSNNTVRS